MCPPHLDNLCIGFSFLFIKEYEQAEYALRKALKRTMEYAPNLIRVNPWCFIQPNLELLENGQTDLIEKNIKGYIQHTCTSLKLV